jgi:hypothetical protein
MTEQAQADQAIGDDLAAAGRIAIGAGERPRNRVAVDGGWQQRLLRDRAWRRRQHRRHKWDDATPQPNTSLVTVLNQPSA